MDIRKELISWLSFNNSPNKDFVAGNNWSVVGTPSVSANNAINGNALQLDGHSGLKCTLTLGGQDFTIDGWVYVDSNTGQYSRILNIFSKATKMPMLILERWSSTTTKFNLWTNNNVGLQNYNGHARESSIASVGRRCHFRICYYWSSATLQLYIDGAYASYVWANQYPEQDFDLYVGTGSQELNEDLGIIGAIDELTIYNGIALNPQNTNFITPNAEYYQSALLNFQADIDNTIVKTINVDFDTQLAVTKSQDLNADTIRAVTNAVTVNFDTARDIQGDISLDLSVDIARNVTVSQVVTADLQRSIIDTVVINIDAERNIRRQINLLLDAERRINHYFRYENYGTADLLSVPGTTVENLEKSQAVYKTAFYQTAQTKCFDIPATKEIWIKCDIYTLKYGFNDKIYIGSDDGNGFNGWGQPFYNEVYKLFHNGTEQALAYKLGQNTYYPLWLHMRSGISDGLIEFRIGSGELDGSFTGNVNNGEDFSNVYIAMTYSKMLVSNIIISNEFVDISENATLAVNLTCDSLRILFTPFELLLPVDTCRNVVRAILLNNDLCRNVKNAAQILADTQIVITHSIQLNCDAIRTLPHNVILSPVNEFGGTPDTSNDKKALCQSIEIRLNEQSLTDEIILTVAKPIDIMDQVQGQYLDYKYNMRAESIKQRGVLRTCTCCSDIDEILYKQLDYTIPDDESWYFVNPDEVLQAFPRISCWDNVLITPEEIASEGALALASTHIATIANVIGKIPVLQFADFISTVDMTSGGTTYNDLIRSIFGWTARIPQHMINCFLRDDKLFVIQRGFEQNEIDLTFAYGIDIVSVDKELVRTIWGSSVWSKTETREVFGYNYYDDLQWQEYEPSLPAGTPTPTSSKSYNKDGLIRETVEEHNGITTSTSYEYTYDGLVAKITINVSSQQEAISETITTYEYTTLADGRRVLKEEHILEREPNEKGFWQTINDKTTTHEYTSTGSGQVHHYQTDSDGNINNVMGNGNGDDRRTPYSYFLAAQNKLLTGYSIKSKYFQAQRTIYGLTPFDTSFPVHGDQKLIEITEAIKWLNRRVQETVTLNLFDYPHVIDFNDRIVINGNVYYLKSNTALKTTHIVNKQTLSLVRWY